MSRWERTSAVGPVTWTARLSVLESALLVLIVVLFIGPILMLLVNGLRSGIPGNTTGWSLDGFRDGLGDGEMLKILAQTVVYAVAVATTATIGGTYFAWLFARTTVRLHCLIPLLVVAVIATPALFYAIAYDALANEHTGMLNVWWRNLFGGDTGPLNIQSWAGMIFVATLKSMAFSFVLIVPAFLRMSPSLEEAARISGSNQIKVLLEITVPVLLPSILGAWILACIHAMEAFEVPLVLGSPADIQVLSTQVFRFLNLATGPNYAAASALAVPVLILVLGLLRWARVLLGDREYVTVAGKAGGGTRNAPGPWAFLHSVLIAGFAAVALLLPVIQVIGLSTTSRVGTLTGLSLRQYREIWDRPDIMSAIWNTWLLAAFGGLVIGLFCTGLSWVVQRSRSRIFTTVAHSVWLGTAMPGILLGIAIFSMVVLLPATREIYGTIWLLFLGLFVAAVPVSMRGAEGNVRQVGVELYEAARVHGARPLRAWFGSVAPLLAPGTASAWFVAAMVISSNVAVPMLLSTPSTSLLAVVALDQYSTGFVQLAAAMICVNLAIWFALFAIHRIGLLLFRGVRYILDDPGPSPALARQGSDSYV